jgi:FixJ family two-component response regulator
LLAEKNLPQRACMVVDYRMPDIDGLELVRCLRDRHVDLPAILISGRVNDQLRRRAALSGISSVLEKPLSDGILVDSIREALRIQA